MQPIGLERRCCRRALPVRVEANSPSFTACELCAGCMVDVALHCSDACNTYARPPGTHARTYRPTHPLVCMPPGYAPVHMPGRRWRIRARHPRALPGHRRQQQQQQDCGVPCCQDCTAGHPATASGSWTRCGGGCRCKRRRGPGSAAARARARAPSVEVGGLGV